MSRLTANHGADALDELREAAKPVPGRSVSGTPNGQLPTNMYGVCPDEARLGAEAATSCPYEWPAFSGEVFLGLAWHHLRELRWAVR